MQDIDPPSSEQLLAIGQRPLAKVEIWVDPDWINLCNLGGKNYVQDVSISLGGAGMTPSPVEGTWSATILNKDGVFHPDHPTSPYKDYLKTERRVRISVGATYGGTPYYWPRITGYMSEPKFSAPDYSVAISGGDYMKRLQETQLKFPDNYWGDSEPFTSIPSDGVIGDETYDEADAMTIEPNEVNDIPVAWVRQNCTFLPVADARPGSAGVKAGEVIPSLVSRVKVVNSNVCAGVEGDSYQVKFWHRIVDGDGSIPVRLNIRQDAGDCVRQVYYPTDDWKEETIEFTARDNTAIRWVFRFRPIHCHFRVDDFSIKRYKFYYDRYYDITDANEKGPYRITLDTGAGAEDVWQAEEDEGWWHEEVTRHIFFDINKVVAGGEPMVIYYFMPTSLKDIVARLLYYARVCDPNTDEPYATEGAAEARMEGDDPAIDIDKVWFKPGSTCLNAIKKICERCNYRFYFKYDGTPVFRIAPAADGAVFIFTDPKHIASVSTYQDPNEIKNRIVIQGMKQTSPINRDDTVSSEFKGELADDGAGGSIELYGERTLTINNHLFQDQDSIDHAATGMCKILLDEYKIPKWYADLEMPFLPVPLDLGDNIQWEERLSPILNIVPSPTGLIRDMKIDNFNATYKCVLT